METYSIFEIVHFCTVDGRNPAPVEVGSLSHYLHGFIHPRWLFWISFMNSGINISTFCVATNHLRCGPIIFVSTWRLHITHKMNNRPKRRLQGVRLPRKLMVLVDLKRKGEFRGKMFKTCSFRDLLFVFRLYVASFFLHVCIERI